MRDNCRKMANRRPDFFSLRKCGNRLHKSKAPVRRRRTGAVGIGRRPAGSRRKLKKKGLPMGSPFFSQGTVRIDSSDWQYRCRRTAQRPFWAAALLRRTSVLACGQNLGSGGIHFRRACKISPVSIKITTPNGVVIFMVRMTGLEPVRPWATSTSS